jgi:hypothetical protein
MFMFPNFTALHMVAQVILCTLLSQEQNYRIEVTADADKNNAIRIDWRRESQRAQKDHTLCCQLKQQGIRLSRDSIRNIMSTRQRLTITLPPDDNKTIHLRTSSRSAAEITIYCLEYQI